MCLLAFRPVLQQQDGQGVWLFPTGAPDAPETEGTVPGLPPCQEDRQDHFLDGVEGARIPKKLGDVDREGPDQMPSLYRVLANQSEVGPKRGRPASPLANGDPAEEEPFLVQIEVDPPGGQHHVTQAAERLRF
jgi:hypothetical protein